MPDLVYLKDIVIILAVAVAVVAALSRLGVPSIAGFILAGILVGPDVLGLIKDIHKVEILAEIGVALLLFGIGLELSLDKIKRLWWLVITAGSFQVILTAGVTLFVARFFDLPLLSNHQSGGFFGRSKLKKKHKEEKCGARVCRSGRYCCFTGSFGTHVCGPSL